jgi:hypothetical protein
LTAHSDRLSCVRRRMSLFLQRLVFRGICSVCSTTGEDDSMKTNHKVTLAVLACLLFGVAGSKRSYACQGEMPCKYVIAEVNATDLGSGYPYWCAPGHSSEQGKSARKPQHRQRAADIVRRPMRRSSRSGGVQRKGRRV